MTLSTAQPQLNATPPELLALDVSVIGRAALPRMDPQQAQSGAGMMGMGGGMGGRGKQPVFPRPVARAASESPGRADRQPRRGRPESS